VLVPEAGRPAGTDRAGDTQQLQAVENGGGLCLLADALDFVQLAEPVRFRAGWEQAASLRLRDGDTAVLAEYDQHARITGGEPEQMMDAAAADYLALILDGTDVLLMAADHALRRELSRRIRDDLIRLGVVAAAPAVRIADGAAASAGDLIICTKNDHSVEAGEPGRTLANRDLLRIDAVTPGGLAVRRALDADPATGQRRWTDRTFLYSDYGDAELGYAVTDHVAQGRTVHTGLAAITGTEDRQHAYVAMSRGTDMNMAYVSTVSPKLADPVPGPRPAPELTRYDRLTAEYAGRPADTATKTGDALLVLAGVLGGDGQQLSASQTWRQALADADHLAILNATRMTRSGRSPSRPPGQPCGLARGPGRPRPGRWAGRAYQQRETVFATVMADRADWDAATHAQRRLAVAADAELRRRHPDQHYPQLRSAEPDPATETQRAELTLTAGQPIGKMGQWIKDLAAAHRTFAERLANLQSLVIPSEDADYGDLGQAFPPWPRPGRDAILQPPKPEIRPSLQVLERATDRDADWEAAE